MSDRWATFDCYGTLIDWNQGIGNALQALWPEVDRETLLRTYHEFEPRVEAGAASLYRDVLRLCTERIAVELDLKLPVGDETALADTLPTWPPFPDVHAALQTLADDGWRLAVLSNTDPDLLAGSLAAIGVPIDLAVTVEEAGSYKPAPGHWEAFRTRSGATADRHVHVAASLFHDIAPCAAMGIPAVWINRVGETSDVPRTAELAGFMDLPATLSRLIPA